MPSGGVHPIKAKMTLKAWAKLRNLLGPSAWPGQVRRLSEDFTFLVARNAVKFKSLWDE
jgi:hypothetical protein